MTDEKLMETLKNFVPPKVYAMRTHELSVLCEANNGDTYRCIMHAFRYGFIQGQKAAKAEGKREKKNLMERDTSGWYGYLSRFTTCATLTLLPLSALGTI